MIGMEMPLFSQNAAAARWRTIVGRSVRMPDVSSLRADAADELAGLEAGVPGGEERFFLGEELGEQDRGAREDPAGQHPDRQLDGVGGREQRQHLHGLRGHREPEQAAVDGDREIGQRGVRQRMLAEQRGLAFEIASAPPKLAELAVLYGVAGLLSLSAPSGSPLRAEAT